MRLARAIISFVLIGCLFLTAPLSFARPVRETTYRSLWVWDIKTPQETKASKRLFSFCKRNDINLIFVSCYSLPPRLEGVYRRFIRAAHRNGISVHALSGDPRWTLSRYHDLQLMWVETILGFNARVERDERFDGIHSDIEPHGLPNWEAETKGLLAQYLELVDRTNAVLERAGSDITFCLDVPFWWDEDPKMVVEHKGVTKRAIEHVMERVPSVAVLDYRNFAEGPNGSIELVSTEFDIAERTNTKVYIGQETQTGLEPRYVTFGGRTVREMEEEIAKLVAAYAGRAGFAGIAIHHYVSYRKMLEKS